MSTQRSQSSAIQDDFVRTGEAVTLDVTPASPPERFAAAVMDATTYTLCTLVLFLMAARFTSPSASIQRVIIIGFLSITMFFLPLVVEIATRGRSLGKWAFNLRVVRDDGGAITARHSAVRVSTGILENWGTFGGLAALAEIMSSKGKRLGDLAAGTMVCSQGASVFYPPLVLPPGLEDWARTATILPRRGPRRGGSRLPAVESLVEDGRASTGRRLTRAAPLASRADASAGWSPPGGCDRGRAGGPQGSRLGSGS